MGELLIAILVMLVTVGVLAGWMVRADRLRDTEPPTRQKGGGGVGG
jgi:hypothetical protein